MCNVSLALSIPCIPPAMFFFPPAISEWWWHVRAFHNTAFCGVHLPKTLHRGNTAMLSVNVSIKALTNFTYVKHRKWNIEIALQILCQRYQLILKHATTCCDGLGIMCMFVCVHVHGAMGSMIYDLIETMIEMMIEIWSKHDLWFMLCDICPVALWV